MADRDLDSLQAQADEQYHRALDAEDRGDADAVVSHFLRVRALDAKIDSAVGLGSPTEIDHIEDVARRTLASLPEPFLSRLAHVPVVLERRPSRDLVQSGFDPRSLGLFDGAIHGDTDTPSPTRIVLYTCNLLAEFPVGAELDEQIEITMLHEVGHFFGLDEAQLHRLGLG